MSIKKSISNTINNFKIMINIHRLNRDEKLSLVHPNIRINGLSNEDFPTEDIPTYIQSSGFVYKMTRKNGRFL